MTDTTSTLEGAGKSLLIIAVPGLRKNLDQWDILRDALLEDDTFAGYEQVDWRTYEGGPHFPGFLRLSDHARRLGAWINAHWESHSYDEVILVAHSAGAALVRQAWLRAVDPLQTDYDPGVWARRVSRFVLFAGVSRGIDMRASRRRRFLTHLVDLVPGRFSVEDLIRGSIFLTNLRIGWTRYTRSLAEQDRPVVAQVLGTEDSLVSIEDSIDVDSFPVIVRKTIPGANHENLFHLGTGEDRDVRLRLIRGAFTQLPAAEQQVRPSTAPEDVLFIVHGIRASGSDDWVKRAQEKVAARWPKVAVRVPHYGYMSARSFALPRARRRYTRHFRDLYSETVAEAPTAAVHVLAHSNGTYLLGKSLRDIDSVCVGRVALGGSVLPEDYGWDALMREERVSAVRSDGGARDVPVALLCKSLRSIGMRDLGTGGYDGFISSRVRDGRYHDGGHGAMLKDDNLESMLEFVVEGRDELPAHLNVNNAPLRRLSRSMRFIAPLLALAALAGAVALVVSMGWPGVAIVLAAALLIYIVLDVA